MSITPSFPSLLAVHSVASVVYPHSASSFPRGRVLARALLPLSPIAIGFAVALLAWWPRPRPPVEPPRIASAFSPVEQERKLSEAIEKASASTVALEYGDPGGRRAATGVVVSDRGDVLSFRIDPPSGRDRSTIQARDAAGHRYSVQWLAADPETGLTLLRVEAGDIRPIRPAARAAILGAAVFVIGNPYGLAHSVGRGAIAGLNRRVAIGPRPLGGLIQVQAPLHPGDSGALLADLEGGWLGLIRSGARPPGAKDEDKDDDDLGFAIPAEDAMWVAGQLLANRKVDRAYFGIRLSPDGNETGAGVAEVDAGSPAGNAGLLAGDRIVRFDDRPILSRDDLTDRLDRTTAGSEVTLEYTRNQVRGRLTVLTDSRPPEPVLPPPATRPAEPVPAVPRELLDRLERLERQLEESLRHEKQVDAP